MDLPEGLWLNEIVDSEKSMAVTIAVPQLPALGLRQGAKTRDSRSRPQLPPSILADQREERVPMSEHELSFNSIYEAQAQLAERELSAFIQSVTELFGPDEARSSAEDWLEEAERVESLPTSTERDWRSVTVVASARLASRRIDAERHGQKFRPASTDIKVSPIRSFDGFRSVFLV